MLWAVCNTLPAATPNVHYSGKLVAGACNLVVDNDTMATVDFHTIGSDNFDASGQTTPVPFTLSLQCGEAIIFTLIRDDEKMAQTQQWRGLRKILRILHSARENDLKMIFLH